ncbi:MAG: hypothetical protein MUF02_10255 [Acidobacteria bacterium]|nr:hypothetical protein [Acidobacteriota bacterium]
MQKVFRVVLSVLFISFLTAALSFAQSDIAGSKDHPLFSRLPGFYIAVYETSDFNSHTFWNEKRDPVKVDGRYYQIQYEPKEGTNPPSTLQIHRNYENAIKQIGGTVLYGDDEYSYMKLVKGDKEIWVELTAYGPKPNLVIIEKQAMKQDVLANADAFAKDIRSSGHAAVYGIYLPEGRRRRPARPRGRERHRCRQGQEPPGGAGQAMTLRGFSWLSSFSIAVPGSRAGLGKMNLSDG